jgi:hypothetical protein
LGYVAVAGQQKPHQDSGHEPHRHCRSDDVLSVHADFALPVPLERGFPLMTHIKRRSSAIRIIGKAYAFLQQIRGEALMGRDDPPISRNVR